MQFEQKISPALWFDKNAEEAVNFYISIFQNSKINKVLRYGKAGPGPEGTIMTISFELDGEEFTAINGGPHFTFSPAILARSSLERRFWTAFGDMTPSCPPERWTSTSAGSEPMSNKTPTTPSES